ncbi:MAG: type II secretion system protein GspG [Planctomycetota bacterium]|nr:type II secretion system protein GspG [Planctomycetota bacterium]
MQHYVGVVCLALIVGGTLWLRHENPPEAPVASEPEAEPSAVAEALVRSLWATAEVQMERIGQAIDMYKLMHKSVPDSLDQLTEPQEDGNRLMDELPDDPWGNEYDYRPDGLRRFHLSSAGPDGLLDTDDDIVHGK